MRRSSNRAVLSLSIFIVAIYPALQSQAAPPRQAQPQTSAQPANQSDPSTPRTKKSVVYCDKKYGLRFFLPKSWKGYSILREEWTGRPVTEETESEAPHPETGPEIIVRHPLWTDNDPRQDIPIMIFTHAQWRLVQNHELAVSAAPVPPCELSHNAQYVFALPPRYNFAFETGYEEVGKILARNSMRSLCPP